MDSRSHSHNPPDEVSRSSRDEKHSADLRVDGGRRAWATLVGGFLTTTATFGYVNAFGVYQDIYTCSDTASASRISWIGSTQLFFLLGMGLPAGKLLDMGYFRQTTLLGSFIYVFSLFMVSLAHRDKYYQIYLSQGLGMGIGAGLLYVPAMAVQAHHWHTRRALAMGVVVTGSSVGGIIFPIMLNQLFKGSVGFEWGVRASAFLVLGLLILGNVLMTVNPAVHERDRPKPDMKGILTDTPYMIANFAVLFIDWGLFFPCSVFIDPWDPRLIFVADFYLQLFAILHGVDPNIAFYTLAIMNASSIPGRVIPNFIADKLGPYNAIIPSTLACCVLLFAMFGVKSVASTIVFAVLYGFFSGAFLSLCAPAVASLSRDPSEVGIRFGLAFFLTAFGALTGTPIDGALLANTFPWSKAIIFSAISVLGGALLLVVARHLITKRKGTQLV